MIGIDEWYDTDVLVDHTITQDADAGDLHLDHIGGHQEHRRCPRVADPSRRPLTIRSPGSSRVSSEQDAISAGTSWIRLLVGADYISRPLTSVHRCSTAGAGYSSAVTTHG
ncbi:MAG: hypothetical protein ACO4CU_14065, partial [Ilumatobacteraceae bacterium]